MSNQPLRRSPPLMVISRSGAVGSVFDSSAGISAMAAHMMMTPDGHQTVMRVHQVAAEEMQARVQHDEEPNVYVRCGGLHMNLTCGIASDGPMCDRPSPESPRPCMMKTVAACTPLASCTMVLPNFGCAMKATAPTHGALADFCGALLRSWRACCQRNDCSPVALLNPWNALCCRLLLCKMLEIPVCSPQRACAAVPSL